MQDAGFWDERYGQQDLVWSAGPNMFVEQVCSDLSAGRVLDLAAGEGRNALWLAGRGWRATAVDFSSVGLARAERLAAALSIDSPGSFRTVCADLLEYVPVPQGYDLVLIVYLQVSQAVRGHVIGAAAAAVAPGGLLLVVAHDSENLAHGYGGPQDPAVLYTAEDVVADLGGTGLQVERAERVVRPVATVDGTREALDSLVLARR